jgi:hypothetical protein
VEDLIDIATRIDHDRRAAPRLKEDPGILHERGDNAGENFQHSPLSSQK